MSEIKAKAGISTLLEEIRAQEPSAAEIDQAAARVRQRLFPPAQASGGATGTIRNCAGFAELFPAAIAGSLDGPRQLLLDAHIRECIDCRRSLDRLRQGAARVIVMPAPVGRRVHYQPLAIAASILLVAGAAGYYGYYEFPAVHGGPRATVEQIDGALYRVHGSSLVPVSAGMELAENDTVRTARNSTAILRLNDGSKVEMNQRAQIYVTRSWTGSIVHLGLGSVIVQAAKQRKGSLQVSTADCNVSVKGTVFSVDAGTKGSRVAVAEGTVWVDHGSQHDVLHKGDQVATAPDMTPAPIADQFNWSRNSPQYLALLGDLVALNKQIETIPAPGLRYQSKLMSYLPANTVALAAIPNIGGAIAEADKIFQQKLMENGELAVWWKQVRPEQRANLERTLQTLSTASQYLGNEIVVYLTSYTQSSPVVLAEEARPGLDGYLKSQLPPEITSHMRFDNNLFVLSENPADTAGGFTQTPLYQKIAPEYQQGAGFLFAADASTIAHTMPAKTGMQDIRYFVATSKSPGAGMFSFAENHASLIFSKPRTGVVSWLAVPGPMGSLNFVSPDAGFAVATILRNPSLIVDDLMKSMSQMAGQTLSITDLASAFGGEVAIALDGPMLPVPAWKIVAEVYDPNRLQNAFTRLVDQFNSEGPHDRTGDLKLTQTEADGQTYYQLKFEKLPWEADWAFVEGYWVAGASHELIIRSIQNRLTGYTLPKSAAFQAQLPHDRNADFSALIYHNMGQTLTPLLGLIGGLNVSPVQQKAIDALKTGDTGGLISFWAGSDRIDIATKGSIFGIDVPGLLEMQASGPLGMMKAAIAR
jgi:hypothetical protein